MGDDRGTDIVWRPIEARPALCRAEEIARDSDGLALGCGSGRARDAFA